MEPLVEPNLVVPAGIARMANCDAAGDCGWECVVKDTVLDVEIDVESLVDAELHRILDAADVAAVVSRDGGDASRVDVSKPCLATKLRLLKRMRRVFDLS